MTTLPLTVTFEEIDGPHQYTAIPLGFLPCGVCHTEPSATNTPIVPFVDPQFGNINLPIWLMCQSCTVLLNQHLYTLLGNLYVASLFPHIDCSPNPLIRAHALLAARDLFRRLDMSRTIKAN